jgi:hypothetical protein
MVSMRRRYDANETLKEGEAARDNENTGPLDAARLQSVKYSMYSRSWNIARVCDLHTTTLYRVYIQGSI